MKNKKGIYVIIGIIFLIVILLFISKNMTRKSKIGNNMNSQEIVDYILNINSYSATANIQVNSNKNNNKYIIKQEYSSSSGCVQEVLEPSNIAGVKITRKDDSITIQNTNLSLTTIFNNHKVLEDNSLDLQSFINDYKTYEKSFSEETDKEIILKTESNINKYVKNKSLYINKDEAIPTKLIIKDDNQNTTIIIEYSDIELN